MKIDTTRSLTVAALRALLAIAVDTDTVEFTRTLKKDQIGTCWCGCGASTKSKFAPGHDSKFHSLAKQVARGQVTMEDALEPVTNLDAIADFKDHVAKERPLWAEKQAKIAAEKAAKPVKVKAEAKNPTACIGKSRVTLRLS